MRRALFLARKGMGKTSPNPMVGAIILRHGKIVGEGYHHGPGQPHAEVMALGQAGRTAKGGTLYTNLEPCCHTGKRTPPCTNAIIESGIARVVIAMEDPNPKVCGRGVKILRKAGISVTTGLLKQDAQKLNETFTKYMTTKRPFVLLKAAMTLDGKIATKMGESRWISGRPARQEVHRLRSLVDAVLVGIGTVLADNPGLLANRRGFKNPLRVVIDPSLKIPVSTRLVLSCRETPTLVLTTRAASSIKLQELKQLGVRVETLPTSPKGKIAFQTILTLLGKTGITSLLIEGGGKVNGMALREGVVDKVLFYIAPKLLCGNDAKDVTAGVAIASLARAVQIQDMTVSHVGDDLRVEGYLQRKK